MKHNGSRRTRTVSDTTNAGTLSGPVTKFAFIFFVTARMSLDETENECTTLTGHKLFAHLSHKFTGFNLSQTGVLSQMLSQAEAEVSHELLDVSSTYTLPK